MLKIDKYLSFLLFSVFGICVFVIHLFTPIHSDDFYFSLDLRTFNDKLWHYNNWSGRVIADMMCTLILTFREKWILATIQTIGFLGIIYSISQLAYTSRRQSWNACSFLFIGLLYFLFQPALGHTVFWIVGTATYMWTNLFIVLFFTLLLQYYYSNRLSYWIYPLALIAGCGNENTLLFVSGLTFIIIIVDIIKLKKIRLKLLPVLILNIIGGSVLLFSPGSKIRLKRDFAGWDEISAITKLKDYLLNKFEIGFWMDIKKHVFVIMGLYLLIYFTKGIKIFDDKKKLTNFSFTVIFLVFAVLSDIIMSQAPVYPIRAKSGPFFFMIIAYSFTFYDFFQFGKEIEKARKMIYIGLLVLSLMFIKFYVTKLFPYYKSINEQNKVQLQIIEKGKQKGEKLIRIPRFYTDGRVEERIRIETYENPFQLARYYGVDSVEFVSPGFDFSKLNTKNSLVVNKNLGTKGGLKNVYVYENNGNANFLIELSKMEHDSLKPIYGMFFHIIDKDGRFLNHDVGEIKPFEYEGKYLINRNTDVPIWNVDSVKIGYFNRDDWRIRLTDEVRFSCK